MRRCTMKKYLFGLVIILTLSIIAILPAKGYAGWVLYDDFEYNGDPNPDLWIVDSWPSGCGPSAEINVIGGEAVFTHNLREEQCSAWLKIKNIEKIKAVRVTVRFDVSCSECSGYVNGRIGAYIGQDDEGNFVFNNIAVKEGISEIGTGTVSISHVDDSIVYRIFDSTYGYRPIDPFYGEEFTIEMNLNRNHLKFTAFGFGETSFKPPQRILTYDGFMAAIGTRNAVDPGFECSCNVYFDDVYVKY
jgi:hypothetical protein